MKQNTTTNLRFNIKAFTSQASVSVSSVDIPRKVIGNKKWTAAEIAFLATKGITRSSSGITVVKSATSVSSSIANAGSNIESTTFSISGIVPYNEKVTVASISIAAKDGEKLTKIPILKVLSKSISSNFDKNLKFNLRKTSETKDSNGVITGYNFNLEYRNSREITEEDDLTFIFKYRAVTKSSRKTKSINKIYFGESNINPHGEERLIKIFGIPKTNFSLTVTNEDGDSILENPNASFENDTGTQSPCVSGIIPTTGVYVINQRFPMVPLVRKTAINGSMAASGATQIIFSDLTDVSVGDQLFMSATSAKAVKVVELNPGGSNVNECTVSQSVTAADESVVEFRKSTTYNIHVTTTDSLNANLPTTNPMYTLNQYLYPQLTMRASTTARTYSINSQAIPGSGTQTYDFVYSGRPLKKSSKLRDTSLITKNTTISYVADSTDTDAITVIKTPSFSNIDSSVSDWTNTVPSENGGTYVVITPSTPVLSTADGHANNACTISFVLTVLEWGSEDVVMELDLDNIISSS